MVNPSLIAVFNRYLSPSSKNLIGDWYEDTFLENIFHVSPSKFNRQNYWIWMNVFDEPTIDRIQDDLCDVLVNKFNVDLRFRGSRYTRARTKICVTELSVWAYKVTSVVSTSP